MSWEVKPMARDGPLKLLASVLLARWKDFLSRTPESVTEGHKVPALNGKDGRHSRSKAAKPFRKISIS